MRRLVMWAFLSWATVLGGWRLKGPKQPDGVYNVFICSFESQRRAVVSDDIYMRGNQGDVCILQLRA